MQPLPLPLFPLPLSSRALSWGSVQPKQGSKGGGALEAADDGNGLPLGQRQGEGVLFIVVFVGRRN